MQLKIKTAFIMAIFFQQFFSLSIKQVENEIQVPINYNIGLFPFQLEQVDNSDLITVKISCDNNLNDFFEINLQDKKNFCEQELKKLQQSELLKITQDQYKAKLVKEMQKKINIFYQFTIHQEEQQQILNFEFSLQIDQLKKIPIAHIFKDIKDTQDPQAVQLSFSQIVISSFYFQYSEYENIDIQISDQPSWLISKFQQGTLYLDMNNDQSNFNPSIAHIQLVDNVTNLKSDIYEIQIIGLKPKRKIISQIIFYFAIILILVLIVSFIFIQNRRNNQIDTEEDQLEEQHCQTQESERQIINTSSHNNDKTVQISQKDNTITRWNNKLLERHKQQNNKEHSVILKDLYKSMNSELDLSVYTNNFEEQKFQGIEKISVIPQLREDSPFQRNDSFIKEYK